MEGEEEDHLCLLEEVEVVHLRVVEADERTGSLSVGLGLGGGGQSDFVEEEGERGLGQEVEDPVCRAEEVEVQKLLCSTPSSPPPSLQTAR